MRYIYSSLSICLPLFILLSCANFLLPPLEVISISTKDNIVITLSAQPSEAALKTAFSMTEDGQLVSGYFTFNDRTVTFSPVNGIRENREYFIIITTAAEDRNGVSLLKDFEYRFFTKDNTGAPSVLSISPADQDNLTVTPERISIVFSKPVDIFSFERALSITPAITYVLEWNESHSAVDIIPIRPLSGGTRYTLTISTALTDLYRNALLVPFVSTFLYGLDRNPPVFSVSWETPNDAFASLTPGTVNSYVPSDSDFLIRFDKPVLIDAIAGFIEITPPISFIVTPDLVAKDNARIVLNQRPEWNRTYTIKVREGITDTFGNRTETEVSYPVIFNATRHRPVTFAGGFLRNHLVYEYINFATDYTALTLNVTHFNPSGYVSVPTSLYYAFRISEEAESISLVSAMRAISISTRNASAHISIRTMNILSPSDPEFNAVYCMLNNNDDGKLCILRIGIEIENTDNSGFIIFSIRNDIADTLGNTMINSLNFTRNKQ